MNCTARFAVWNGYLNGLVCYFKDSVHGSGTSRPETKFPTCYEPKHDVCSHFNRTKTKPVRAAQVLNMEEALRKLDATRAALQEEYDAVVGVKVRSFHHNLLRVFDLALRRPFDLCPGAVERDVNFTDEEWGGYSVSVCLKEAHDYL